MSINEVNSLTDNEREVLLEQAQFGLLSQAMTNRDLQNTLQQQLQPTLRDIRASRQQQDTGGGVGPPSGGRSY
jgi:hypothetical protein